MKIENDLQKLNIPRIKQQDNDKIHNLQALRVGQYPINTNKTPNFTGGFDLFLRFLDTNQAWGATFVDLGFMVLPRTLTDFTRNGDAGVETLRREGSGTANHAMIGLYGTVAGLLLASGLNKAYNFGKKDVKASAIFADSETIDMQGKIYEKALKAAENNTSVNPIKTYLEETLRNYEALSPHENAQWVRFDDASIEKAAQILEKEIKADTNKLSKDAKAQIRGILLSSSGVENNYRILAKQGERLHSSRYDLNSVIENMYKLGKVFNKDTVIEAFKDSQNSLHDTLRNAGVTVENAFIKALKKLNLKRSLLGIGIASAVGVSAQPVNMYLTKLKTGKSGFVGGGEEDKSNTFKLKKGIVATLFGTGVMATIGHPKNLLKNLQFKGLSPTINQFKFIYGITIMSRFLSARNDNELKEATFKDVLGFANWLLLGNFVQKLVAQTFDKTLLKREGKGVLNWIKNSSLKTRDEILIAHLGSKAFDKTGKALPYEKMLELADKTTKTKIKHLKIAQIMGYIYSGLVLGIGIPKLNIYLTQRRMAKQQATQDKTNTQQPNVSDNMLKPANLAFLNSMKNFTGSAILK